MGKNLCDCIEIKSGTYIQRFEYQIPNFLELIYTVLGK